METFQTNLRKEAIIEGMKLDFLFLDTLLEELLFFLFVGIGFF